MELHTRPVTGLSGRVSVPGDKSITHRALLLGGIGDGTSRIDGFLDSGDCRATIGCLQALGIRIERPASSTLQVHGKGLRGLAPAQEALDCIRSGTTMRLMAGLLAGQTFDSVLTANQQLLARPMDRVIGPLRSMGACISGGEGDRFPPLAITGSPLRGAVCVLPMASAQVKSAILLAGLYAEGPTTVQEPGPSRDHTERMLTARGVPVHSEGLVHTLRGPAPRLSALDVRVPGDFSSAAFPIVAALLVPHSDIVVENVGINPTRTGLLDSLLAMGADITLEECRQEGGEPVADLRVRSSDLQGVSIGGDLVPRTIDEFPILALAATQASGHTRVRDAAELRVKETDRIATTVTTLRTLGAKIEPAPDGFDIMGPTPLKGAELHSFADHRLGMTIAVAGLIAVGGTVLTDAERIADSYPGFEATMARLAGGARA
ncbi:MAG: 3-phosphoshikimate 1-carboxyvinyltransferase [Anaerolineae bacterium]|jgi:3-phosphoshikimate 1-carboxyvinyltransferase|nr:3-phosphoshikimate 1-carboxyvinyltransferase [Chloroflexota bacterium]